MTARAPKRRAVEGRRPIELATPPGLRSALPALPGDCRDRGRAMKAPEAAPEKPLGDTAFGCALSLLTTAALAGLALFLLMATSLLRPPPYTRDEWRTVEIDAAILAASWLVAIGAVIAVRLRRFAWWWRAFAWLAVASWPVGLVISFRWLDAHTPPWSM